MGGGGHEGPDEKKKSHRGFHGISLMWCVEFVGSNPAKSRCSGCWQKNGSARVKDDDDDLENNNNNQQKGKERNTDQCSHAFTHLTQVMGMFYKALWGNGHTWIIQLPSVDCLIVTCVSWLPQTCRCWTTFFNHSKRVFSLFFLSKLSRSCWGLFTAKGAICQLRGFLHSSGSPSLCESLACHLLSRSCD